MNELIAKEAALKSKKIDHDRYPVSSAKRRLPMASLCKWDKKYTDIETAGVIKIFLLNAVAACSVVRKFEPTN